MMEPVFQILQAYGITIVIGFSCSAVIWAIVYFLDAFQKLSERKMQMQPVAVPVSKPIGTSLAVADKAFSRAPVVSQQVKTTDRSSGGGIPPEHIAVIAAACATYKLGSVVRIDDSQRRAVWVAGGRSVHQMSHNPRR